MRTTTDRNQARHEDVTWLADTGESLTGAAHRLRLSRASLERWLEKHDRDVLARLRAREEQVAPTRERTWR